MKKEYFEKLLYSICNCNIRSELIEDCLTEIIDLARKNGDRDIEESVQKQKNSPHRCFHYETRKTDNFGGYEFMYRVQKPTETMVVSDGLENDVNRLIRAINRNSEINKILFTGEPGTGKTEMANHIANTLNVECYTVNCINLVSSSLGQTPKNVIKVFDTIGHVDKKTLFFFDEIDSIVNNRTNFKDLEEMARVVTAVMRGFDSLEGNDNAIVIAATNLDKRLDSAFVRRFDMEINFDVYTYPMLSKIAFNYFLKFDKDGKYGLNQLNDLKDFLDKTITDNLGKISPAQVKAAIKASFAFAPDDCEIWDMEKLIMEELSKRAIKAKEDGR